MTRNNTYKKFGFEKTVLAIPHLAHCILPTADGFANFKIQRAKFLQPFPNGLLRKFCASHSVQSKAHATAFGILVLFILLFQNTTAQIQQPQTPTFGNFNQQNNNTGNYINNQNTSINSYQNETCVPFTTSYKAPAVNQEQNNQTKQMLHLYKEANVNDNSYIKKQLWELKLRYFKFANPNSEIYKQYQPFYEAAFDSINQMLSDTKALNLKQAVFILENVLYQNKLNYTSFCKQIDNKVHIIKQIIKNEKLSSENNVALNYAIQQLFLKPIKYTDKNGVAKTHYPLKYDFNDPLGNVDYRSQLVTKLLNTGKGQCRTMPLLYLILATEIGAKANIAYSPMHSYIAFPDDENNYFNFECTSGGFTSSSFIMGSGYVRKEAIKSGIYMVPTTTKETVANLLNDLADQHLYTMKGIDDFQLKCDKRTLEIFPNDIMALQGMSNYQSAKTEAATCNAGWPNPKDVYNIPELKNEFEARDNLYNYLDNLGLAKMTEEEYKEWQKSFDLAKAKQESEEIKKQLLIKAKLIN